MSFILSFIVQWKLNCSLSKDNVEINPEVSIPGYHWPYVMMSHLGNIHFIHTLYIVCCIIVVPPQPTTTTTPTMTTTPSIMTTTTTTTTIDQAIDDQGDVQPLQKVQFNIHSRTTSFTIFPNSLTPVFLISGKLYVVFDYWIFSLLSM